MSIQMEEDILAALRAGPNATYVLKNILKRTHPGITTPRVRCVLRRLEREGVVKCIPNPYSVVHLQWRLK